MNEKIIETAQDEIEAIGLTLNRCVVPAFDDNEEETGSIDLTCEVLWSAFNYLKDNRNGSIEDALLFGEEEWIK